MATRDTFPASADIARSLRVLSRIAEVRAISQEQVERSRLLLEDSYVALHEWHQNLRKHGDDGRQSVGRPC